jgi:hypothetical protein
MPTGIPSGETECGINHPAITVRTSRLCALKNCPCANVQKRMMEGTDMARRPDEAKDPRSGRAAYYAWP